MIAFRTLQNAIAQVGKYSSSWLVALYSLPQGWVYRGGWGLKHTLQKKLENV